MIRKTTSILLLTASLGLVACGGNDDDKVSEEAKAAQSTPAEAAKEAELAKTKLDEAVNTYREGDRKTASTQIADAYLEHFEDVEGPLEKIDETLNEKIEEEMSEELRKLADQGVEVSVLAKRVAAVQADLDTAIEKLQAAS